jgi:AraC-like DNA-binding protein
MRHAGRGRHPGMTTIPSNVVDTDAVPQRERFDLWRAVLSATHEAQLPDDSDRAAFRAFARGWHLGQSLVVETCVSAQHLWRSPGTIRADQLDHYIIRLQRQGCWTGEAGGRAVEAGCGSVSVLDMARATNASVTNIENINVILPRDALDDVLPPFDMHGLVLQGAMGTLLRSHLVSLVLNLPRVQAADADHVSRATLSLLAACLAPSRETVARARAPIELARLAQIRRYVDRHLCAPDLSPQSICQALGLSRSTLYALCEPLGGVAAFIQKRRLDRIHAILADPHDRRRISEIAHQHGFVSDAHFSRAFRRAFGASPRDAREAGAFRRTRRNDPGFAADLSLDAYENWVRRLRS